MATKRESSKNKETVDYKPTEREKELIQAWCQARDTRLPLPKVTITQKKAGAAVQMAFDHPDQLVANTLLMQSIGSPSAAFAEGVLSDVVNSATHGGLVDQHAVNFALAMIDGIQPRDELETLLAIQMAAVHAATITFARRLNNVETIPQQDSAERALNKLARTFTTQMETLKRYRSGGKQTVVVQHVNVNNGGQAIVGTIEQRNDRGEG